MLTFAAIFAAIPGSGQPRQEREHLAARREQTAAGDASSIQGSRIRSRMDS